LRFERAKALGLKVLAVMTAHSGAAHVVGHVV